jgi:hypothetical protein
VVRLNWRHYTSFGGVDVTVQRFPHEAYNSLTVMDQQHYGHRLFKTIFDRRPAGKLQQWYEDAYSQRKVFRLYVDIPPTAPAFLNLIQYEFLTDDEEKGFWFRNAYCRVVRKINNVPPAPLPQGNRLLFLTANPKRSRFGAFPDDGMSEALIAEMRSAGFDVEVCKNTTRRKLAELLARFPPDPARAHFEWFHFLGHGGVNQNDSVIVLEKEDGTDDLIKSVNFATLIRPLGVKVAFLQACSSGVAPHPFTGIAQAHLNPLGADIALVLASLATIDAQQSTTFAANVYQQIGLGRTLDEARQLAMNMTYQGNDPGWGFMGLFTRTKDFTYVLQHRPCEILINDLKDPQTRQEDIELIRHEGEGRMSVTLGPRYTALEQARRSRHEPGGDPNDLAMRVRELDTEGLLPPGDFPGDVAFKGGKVDTAIPWEQLSSGDGVLALREKSVVVRELLRIDGKIAPSKGSGGLAVSLGVENPVAQHFADLPLSHYDYDQIPPPERKRHFVCIILSVGTRKIQRALRPVMPAPHRAPPFRPMLEVDLAKLRDKLYDAPAKLLILDFIGAAELNTSIDRSGKGDLKPLVASLLGLRFAHVILTPVSARDDAEWRANFLSYCKVIVKNILDGKPLREAIKEAPPDIIDTMPVLCVSSAFHRIR